MAGAGHLLPHVHPFAPKRREQHERIIRLPEPITQQSMMSPDQLPRLRLIHQIRQLLRIAGQIEELPRLAAEFATLHRGS